MKEKKNYPLKKKVVFSKIVKITQKMQRNLLWAQDCPNGIEKICDFFQEISIVHDEAPELINGFNFGREKQVSISKLMKFLEENGRNKNGWNKTDKWETVTPEKVLIKVQSPLDQVIQTKTVREYLDKKDDPGGDFSDEILKKHHPDENQTHYVERLVVNPFIRRKYKLLSEIVSELQNN